MSLREDVAAFDARWRATALDGLRWIRGVLPLVLVALVLSASALQVAATLYKPIENGLLPAEVIAGLWVVTLFVLWLMGACKAGKAALGGGAFCIVLVVAAVLTWVVTGAVGKTLERQLLPVTTSQLKAGLTIATMWNFAVLTVASACAWRRYAGHWRWLPISVCVVVGQLATLVFLTFREPRWDVSRGAKDAAARGLGRLDVMLVVDPHDQAGRRIIEEARTNARLITAVPRGAPLSDVRFGIVAPRPNGPGRLPLYRTELQPTSKRSLFVRTLRDIIPTSGPPSYSSYGRIFLDAQRDFGSVAFGGVRTGVDWRADARRALVFAPTRPPRTAQMGVWDRASTRRGCAQHNVGADARALCERLTSPTGLFSAGLIGAQSVPFTLALDAYQRRALTALAPLRGPPTDLSVYLLSAGGSPATEQWTNWTQATGGRVIDPQPYSRPTLVQALEDAVTESPIDGARKLAYLYRPHLRLNKGELARPVDVDALFRAPGGTAPEVCDRTRGTADDCVDIRSPLELLREQDEYIDFHGDARKGWQAATGQLKAKMYFDLRRTGRRLHIGYWWYFPVNISPVQSRRTCLPGLTVRELTCYDHEGDWEGVTVTLGLRDEVGAPTRDPYSPAAYDARTWIPLSVSYDAHGRGIRWAWSELKSAGAIEAGTHPAAFAARGSHASYPLRCRRPCTQALANRPLLPEGLFEGDGERDMGDELCERTACLVAMPVVRRPIPSSPPEDRPVDPVLWNAFPGRWGAAVCLPVGQVCSQSDGPLSPSQQGRYRAPGKSKAPNPRARQEFRALSGSRAR